MSQQHANVSQGQICSDNSTCCHTEIEIAAQTFNFIQSQCTDKMCKVYLRDRFAYTILHAATLKIEAASQTSHPNQSYYADTCLTSPSTDLTTPSAWHGSQYSTTLEINSMTWPRKVEGDPHYPCSYRLVGLVIMASALRAEDPGFESRLRRNFSGSPSGTPSFNSCLHLDFSQSSHTSNFKIGTPVATLPGAWCERGSAGTGWPSVSILWLGGTESLICIFYLSVTALKLSEQVHPWNTLTCCNKL